MTHVIELALTVAGLAVVAAALKFKDQRDVLATWAVIICFLVWVLRLT